MISEDFTSMKVILKKSIFNINFHKTIFGGSIFSACDPFFPIMYHYIFKKSNYNLIIWVKSAEINFLKPANSSLELNFNISKDEIEIAKRELDKNDKFEAEHLINAKDNNGVICASATINIYLRKK
tara:strand:+ start:111 stop:488 length:378 start_codon:yes stop_codon:yes gene_type:complete